MPAARVLVERKNYAALPPPAGPYVHAARAGGLLFVSGLSAFGTAAQARGIGEQLDAIFDQLAAIAAAEGGGLDALLKVTLYVTALDDLGTLRETLAQRYGAHRPASSLVRVAGLFSEQIGVELEAVLALP